MIFINLNRSILYKNLGSDNTFGSGYESRGGGGGGGGGETSSLLSEQLSKRQQIFDGSIQVRSLKSYGCGFES